MLASNRSLRRFYLLTILITILTIFVIFNNLTKRKPIESIFNHPYFHFDLNGEEPRQDAGQLCLIPKIHPFDPSIWKHLSDPIPLSCNAWIPTLTFIDDFGWLRVNETALSESGYHLDGSGFIGTLSCYWKVVLRGGTDETADDYVKYGKEQLLKIDGVDVENSEILAVTCRNFVGVPVYENVHAHIRNVTFQRRLALRDVPHNVFIFGMSSLSRQAFIRLLPKTYRYLTRHLNMHVFTGMNIIADNAFSNLVALLTGDKPYGFDQNEIPDFDDWPLIWRNFSSAGYVTLWAEDNPDFGLFNYLDKGFKIPPVDHYLRPFWLAVKNCAILRRNSQFCFRNSPRHQLQLDYVLRFFQKYDDQKSVPYFAFSFLSELSHEHQSQIAVADEDFERFFRVLHNGRYLAKTLVIVMSGPGHPHDAVDSTQISLEERLPFFAMGIPQKVLVTNKHILHHLDINRVRLTNLFDVHTTLLDYLQWSTLRSHTLGERILVSGSRYGRSLFGDIPSNRSCLDAGIPSIYCACKTETEISTADVRVRAAVKVLFFRINKLLKTVKDFCAELSPVTVFNAHVITLDDLGAGKDRIRLTVRAQPSDAIFEATVEVRARENSKSFGTLPYESRVLGDIIRNNKYGNQSNCIRHEVLRKYCYCQERTKSLSNHLRSYQEETRIRGT